MRNTVATATYWIYGTSPVLSNTKGQYEGGVPLVQFEA
jgi:hypothetical protein